MMAYTKRIALVCFLFLCNFDVFLHVQTAGCERVDMLVWFLCLCGRSKCSLRMDCVTLLLRFVCGKCFENLCKKCGYVELMCRLDGRNIFLLIVFGISFLYNQGQNSHLQMNLCVSKNSDQFTGHKIWTDVLIEFSCWFFGYD
eukprot:GHVL01007793.1.p1 GENE.GHVL01007793.1~~GHVL01007793.1.p1  ORF type:complete len:143 (+),score=4.43 GHVL01007793.1:264-692(+)